MARNANSLVLEGIFVKSLSIVGEGRGLGEGVVVRGVFSGDDGEDKRGIGYRSS